MIKKIVIIGPESTGKSTLCKQLAEYFKTQWVPEYAREYLEAHGTGYNFEDLYKIAEEQQKQEDAIFNIQCSMFNVQQPESGTGFLFIDTDLYVMKVWSEFVFNRCDNRILNQIVKRQYDLYLLCNNDIPWVKDSLREYPDLKRRDQLFHHYKDAMINQPVPWVEIKGDYQERFKLAIKAVKSIL